MPGLPSPGVRRCLLRRLGVAPRSGLPHVELPDSANRREDGQHIITVVAQILVGGHERPLVVVRREDVPAVELRVIGEVQQGEDGRHQVNLGAKLLHPPRLDEARGIDDRRYVVLVHRDAGLAGAGGAVVGHDDEHGVAEPRSARGLGEELADGEIGVLHGGGARLHLTVVGDLPFRECVRTMIADCEYDGVERSPALGLLVELLQGHPPVRILVAGTPDVAERYVLLRITVLVDDLEAVAGEVGAHVVEIAVAAVDERGRVAVLPQHGAGGEKSGVVRPFDKAFAGARRNAEGQGLKAADGSVAGGVEVVEDKALFNERVQIPGVMPSSLP